LVRSLWKRSFPTIASQPAGEPLFNPAILLVEDSITTRTQEKRILEANGYTVVAAVDGLDGWAKLTAGSFHAVVTDIQMPNLDGLALAARIRQEAKYRDLPVILVTSLSSEEDRQRGLDVGANAYLAKSGFDQQVLLDTLRRLV
jgi:two-component system, chemotaxis family, sensor kinase CheA